MGSSRGTTIVGRCSEFSAVGSPVRTMRFPPAPGVTPLSVSFTSRACGPGFTSFTITSPLAASRDALANTPSIPDVGSPVIVAGSTVVPLCCPNRRCT